jgi:hypothetical protein
MKKIILIVTIISGFAVMTAITTAKTTDSTTIEVSLNSDYCDGWKDGYCEGWKDVKGQLTMCPMTPMCPMPEIGKGGYKGGYHRGFKAGLKAARK